MEIQLDPLTRSVALKRINHTLAAVASDDAICEFAYKHPNGFVKIDLGWEPDFGQIRIHFWPDGASDGNIHTHRWGMYCYILSGQYEAQEYEEESSENLYVRYRCSENTDGRYLISADQAVTLTGGPIGKPRNYHIPSGRAHRIIRCLKPVLSLVVRERSSITYSYIYAPEGNHPIDKAPEMVFMRDIVGILHQARSLLKGSENEGTSD